MHGLALAVDLLENADEMTLTNWIGELATGVGSTVLVSDDADRFRTAANRTGINQQVCTVHVLSKPTRGRNEWSRPGRGC